MGKFIVLLATILASCQVSVNVSDFKLDTNPGANEAPVPSIGTNGSRSDMASDWQNLANGVRVAINQNVLSEHQTLSNGVRVRLEVRNE